MACRPPPSSAAFALIVLLAGAAQPLSAQTVMQVEGGGNSVTGGYGASLRFWTRQSEGWIGAGYADGWRIGGYAKRIVGRDTIGAGYRMESFDLPTDVFGTVPYALTQGIDWQSSRGDTRWMLLAGVTGTGAGAPYVNTVRAERPFTTALVRRRVSPALNLTGRLVGSSRQSLFAAAHWREPGSPHAAGLSFGLGSNKPYGAISAAGEYDRFTYKASLIGMAPGFRRADAPLPNISESYRENVVVTTSLTRTSSVTVGRQHFRQEATETTPASVIRVHQLLGHWRRYAWNVSGGVFNSATTGLSSTSAFANVARDVGSWFHGSASVYSTSSKNAPRSTTVMLSARERLSPRLSLLQVATRTAGQASVGFGGSYQSGFTSISVDYQTVYVPLREPDPFVRTLALSVRLQLGRYMTSIASSLDHAGNVNYTASGSTFLYLGEFGAGAAPITLKFERFVVRGRVVNEAGEPIEGAAIEVGSEFAVSNSQGDFLVRVPRPGELPLRVALADFTVPGRFEVVSAPATATAAAEERATPVTIVLRRVRSSPAAPPAPAPPDSVRRR